jgi:hypothetical protein
MTNAKTQLASFLAKCGPAMVKLGNALRAKLRTGNPAPPKTTCPGHRQVGRHFNFHLRGRAKFVPLPLFTSTDRTCSS